MTGAKVKQLDWHNFDAWTHWAEAVCGTYHVEERNGYWQVELRVGGLVHGVTETGDTTPEDLDAAKAAAQADYEARILAALEPVAASNVQKTHFALPAPDAADIYPYDAIEQCERDLDGVEDEPVVNEKLRAMYAEYRRAIAEGRLLTDAALTPTPAPDAAAIREAVADLADFLDAQHKSHMTGLGRNPADYMSGYSVARDMARDILITEKPHDRA